MKNSHRNRLIIMLIMILSTTALSAQNTIRGSVTEKGSGAPIPYAYVFIKGTTTATTTAENGSYSIMAAPNAVIVFSCLGYVSMEERVANRATINVALEPESFSLTEVVAIAYSTTRKKDLISSVASVRGDELSKAPVASMNEAMQGKLAGVQISSASGTPGGAITVRIRGASSITAGNDPLYVVDGIPMTATDYSQMGFGGQTNNPLANINPSDIESVQVLKDAAASALYGSRASNGVVLITTKKGKAQKARVTFDTYYGVEDLWKNVPFLRTEEWLKAQNEARANYNATYGYTPGKSGYVAPISAEVPGADTDWFKEVTKANPMIASAQVGVSGGSENTQFYLSSGWFKQEGLQKPSQYERYNFRVKVNHKFNSKVKIDLNASFSTSDNNRVRGDNDIYAPVNNASRNRPDQPIYDPKDPSQYYTTLRNNAVACYKEMYALNRNQRLMGDFKFEWNLIDNLVFKSNVGADFTYIHELRKYSSKAPQAASSMDEARDANTYLNNYIIENTLNYNRKFGKTSVNALAGHSFQQRLNTNNYVAGAGFPTDEFRWLESASINTDFNSSFREFVLESFFGRVAVNIDDKYLFDASIRSDASSKFAKNYRVGIFPAGSFGWRVSKESFFPKNKTITDVKLRGSLGLTGNQEGIAYYRYLTLYSSGMNYDEKAGVFPTTAMSTRDLTWEKTLQGDFGLDLVFFNGRIEFTYDYFLKYTRDLLLSRSVPITTGHSTRTENLGKVRNLGHELAIFSRNINHPKYKWNTSFNITFLDNKVTAIGKNANGEWEGFSTGNYSRIDVGYPVSSFYVIKAIGIYQKDSDVPELLYRQGVRAGDVKYEDYNGDGQITAADMQMYKSGSPNVYGGLSNTFSFKGFDAEFGLQFSLGNHVYAYWKQGDGAGNGGRSNFAISKAQWEKRWTPENPHNNPVYSRFVYGGSSGAAGYNTQTATSRWLQDASFLRIKTLTLGYTLPGATVQKMHIDRVRIYCNVQNLFTFTKYDGRDPEVEHNPAGVAERGVDFNTVPQMRSVTLGINISF